ncbi:MAG TPA: MATE family efflux transporter [Magnetospirillum sp.]|nr:MATE family efflux transporter [Magnetospirillum sp.]
MNDGRREGGVVRPILALSAPAVVVLGIQMLVGLAELFFISRLGPEAVAGVTLATPWVLLLQGLSNGAVGSGIASAVARAMGGGRRDDAQAVVRVALGLAAALGAACALGHWQGGEALFRSLGGQGEVLACALDYAGPIFLASTLIWLVNLLAAALRGSGNAVAPAAIVLAGALVLPLSPALIFGWGPFPRMGVMGAGLGVVAYYLLAALALLLYLGRGRGSLGIGPGGKRWRPMVVDVLCVTGPATAASLLANLALAMVTSAVARFGSQAMAGYGLASRFDLVLNALLFALGTGVLAVVGASVGAGQEARARRAAWAGTAIGGAGAEIMGLTLALAPEACLAPFDPEPAVLEAGANYLRIAGPLYGLAGVSVTLNWAAQGAGRAMLPMLALMARFAVAAAGEWSGWGLDAVFALAALSGAAACAVMVWGFTRPAGLPRFNR